MPHYVLDLRTLTLGKRHDTRDKAVTEFEKLKTASPSDHALAVVEVNYMRGSNGLPQHVSCAAPLEIGELQMTIDQPAPTEFRIVDGDHCVWCEQLLGICSCDVDHAVGGVEVPDECYDCDYPIEDCTCDHECPGCSEPLSDCTCKE